MTLYAIRERTEDEAKNGLYIRLVLTSRSGTISAVYWQVPDEVRRFCKVGAVIDVNGEVGEYKGEPQLKITSCYYVAPEEIRYEELLPTSPYDRAKQWERLDSAILQVTNESLRRFLQQTILLDSTEAKAYRTWPAAVAYHHAWVGGLLDHSLEVAATAVEISKHWPKITDSSLIIAGALLHDIGKLTEIKMGATFEFSTYGRLSGHCLLGIQWLRARAENHPLPCGVYQEIEHIIASHHGQLESGAITTPKTANAMAVHLADMASAKMTMAMQAITGHTGEEPWTAYDRATKTQYFVPQVTQTAPFAEGVAGQ